MNEILFLASLLTTLVPFHLYLCVNTSVYCLTFKGAQKEGGGPNVFMREALNLVDFFVSNYVTQDVDLSTMEVRTDEVTHLDAQLSQNK